MTDAIRPPRRSTITDPALRAGQIASLGGKPSLVVVARSPWYDAWRRFSRNTLAVFGLILLICYFGLTLGADALAPYSFRTMNYNLISSEASYAHLLGTDSLGRDMLTLIMFGSRVSLAVGLIVPTIVLLIAVPIGIIAGYSGGHTENLLMRFTDVVMSLPEMLMVLVLVSAFGRSLWTVIFALSILSWPPLARVVRSETLRLRHAEFVIGARAAGAGPFYIAREHLLPNLIGPIVVTIAVLIPTVIIEEATLTFLNIGVELTNVPSWAQLIRNEFPSIFSRPMQILMPSLAISFLTLSFSFIGDGLRDAFDPRLTDRI